MFTDRELEGCPSPWYEDWLNKNERAIRTIAQNDPSLLENIFVLLFKLVHDQPNHMS